MTPAGKRWIRLHYEALVERHAEVLRCLFRTSDEFSFHTRRLRPFSETDQRLAHDAALAPLSGEMTLRKSGMENWPGKYGRDPHGAYVRYRASARAREVVLSWPDPFEAVERGLPEGHQLLPPRGSVVCHGDPRTPRRGAAGRRRGRGPVPAAGQRRLGLRRAPPHLDKASVKSAAPQNRGAALCRWKAAQNAEAGTRPPE